jgi:hypothetical protein
MMEQGNDGAHGVTSLSGIKAGQSLLSRPCFSNGPAGEGEFNVGKVNFTRIWGKSE